MTDASNEVSRPPGEGNGGPPWPFWGSLGWMLALTGVLSVSQVLVVLGRIFFEGVMAGLGRGSVPDFRMDSGTLFLSQVVATAFVLPSAWWIAYLARTGRTRDYLAFRPFRWRPVAVGFGGVVVLALLSNLVVTEENEFMLDLFREAGSKPLLWASVVVFAPLSEEVVFRGFAFEGLCRASGGAATATAVSSAVWAMIHLQYSWREMSVIFALGLVLGWVRQRTGSVWACMLLHALNNLASCVGMEMELSSGAGA